MYGNHLAQGGLTVGNVVDVIPSFAFLYMTFEITKIRVKLFYGPDV